MELPGRREKGARKESNPKVGGDAKEPITGKRGRKKGPPKGGKRKKLRRK